MSDFLLTLGISSMVLLFTAGLLALLYQYWRNRFIWSVAIGLGIMGGLGTAAFFGSLLLPEKSSAQLDFWWESNPTVPSIMSWLIIGGIVGWREYQDRIQASTTPQRQSHRPKTASRVHLERHHRPSVKPQKRRQRRRKSTARPFVEAARPSPHRTTHQPSKRQQSRPQPAQTPTAAQQRTARPCVKAARPSPHRTTHQPSKRQQSRPQPTQTPTAAQGSSPNLGRHWNRLNALTHDNRTSKRLVKSNLQANPGRSSSWAIEKAISDLERDRRA